MDENQLNQQVKDMVEAADLAQTKEVFTSIVDKSGINDKDTPMDDLGMKRMNIALRAGNLHAKMATVKTHGLRLAGHLDLSRKIKAAVERKVREAARPETE